MHFAALLSLSALPLLALAAPAPAPAPAALPVSGQTQTSSVISARQHTAKRALLDVCAVVDAGAVATVGNLLGTAAQADVCLCLSLFPLTLSLGATVDAVVDLLGVDTANAKLKALVNDSPNKRQCTYPENATPSCTRTDPCGFSCPAGRTRVGGDCRCAAGSFECNGVCQRSSQACGSAVPRSLSARFHAPAGADAGAAGVRTLAQAQATCKSGEVVCGVYNRPGGWECLDVASNLESCGACAIPHPFAPAHAQARGTDCTALPGALAMSCARGACQVAKCAPGYAPAAAGDACVLVSSPAELVLNAQVNANARRESPLAKGRGRKNLGGLLGGGLLPGILKRAPHGAEEFRDVDGLLDLGVDADVALLAALKRAPHGLWHGYGYDDADDFVTNIVSHTHLGDLGLKREAYGEGHRHGLEDILLNLEAAVDVVVDLKRAPHDHGDALDLVSVTDLRAGSGPAHPHRHPRFAPAETEHVAPDY